MRRVLLVCSMALALALGGAGAALAQPPDSDPTCGRGTQSGHECAGDNGSAGCEGTNRAEETPAGEHAGDALDLVTDILSEGEEGECQGSG